MLSKIKKYFFGGVFGALYISFIMQFIYVIVKAFRSDFEGTVFALGLLSLEWLILIAARYLSRKSGSGQGQGRQFGGNGHFRR